MLFCKVGILSNVRCVQFFEVNHERIAFVPCWLGNFHRPALLQALGADGGRYGDSRARQPWSPGLHVHPTGGSGPEWPHGESSMCEVNMKLDVCSGVKAHCYLSWFNCVSNNIVEYKQKGPRIVVILCLISPVTLLLACVCCCPETALWENRFQ